MEGCITGTFDWLKKNNTNDPRHVISNNVAF